MEARATIKEASVSKLFVGTVLILVAMGLGAMGGYVAAGATSTGAAQQVQAHPAPGTVLRQDNPVDTQVYPAPGTVLRQDNPAAAGSSAIQAAKGGTRGDHGDLP